ncbi:DNA-binding SARP family transcriptional activator [Stackebrandtia albiflava]|uniref:DNA-binding SARP family transcriptional activator n=1 Tax=Stackebrandtia albiflava TaxID=406432 RepID=A0A562V308_9ACTN|nr:BTAD domain-containing putative transcriptional regulator [Stackebrandtia albiflava]TWJ12280.1 DNA-binding SARP family transcriptional activator [Stackebrandtia albiflava]
MRFRILGSLEVVEDAGEPVTIAGRHHPRLLGLLLLGANRVLTADRAVEVLWGDDPPATATRQVQNIAGTLRRRLAPGLLERVGSGYRLSVADDRLDAAVFTAAVTAARGHRERGDAAEAWRVLDAGLSVWRGPVLADLSGLSHLTARLEQERLSAIEDRAELSLVLGRAESEIPRLRELAGEHPLRQSLVGVLMRSLHQTGRTAEALDVYNECRTRLADELGIDPGRRLRDLYTAILRDEPAPVESVPAATVSDAPAAPTVPRPAQLPHPPGRFVGRAAELAILDTLPHRPGGAVAAITGQGGVGKTALALHWAHRHATEFPDGQLYLNLRGFDDRPTMTVSHALAELLRSLGHADSAIPDDPETAATLWRSTLNDKRAFILFDNALDAAQLRPLLPGSGENLIVVTSRNRLTGLVALDDAIPIPLPGLASEDSRALLREILPGDPPASALDRLAERCEHLPLALRIAAANLLAGTRTIDDYVRGLDDDRIAELALADEPGSGIAATITASVATMPEPIARGLAVLGMLPGTDFTASLAAAVLPDGSPDAGAVLERLSANHLVELHSTGRYRMHDLVRWYANRMADRILSEAERFDVRDRAIEWCYGNRGSVQLPDYDNVMLTCRAFADHPGSWRGTLGLTRAVNRGYRVAALRKLFAEILSAAERAHDIEGRTKMTAMVGATYWALGNLEEALDYKLRAVELAEELDDDLTRQVTLANCSVVLMSNCRFAEAEEMSLRCRKFIPPDDLRRIRTWHIQLVGTRLRLGRFAAAEEDVQRSLEISAMLDDPGLYAATHVAAADFMVTTRRIASARRHIAEALTLAESVDSHRDLMQVVEVRARLHVLLNEGEAALGDYREVADLASQTGDRLFECMAHQGLAMVSARAGDTGTALRHIDTAAKLNETVRHRGVAADLEMARAAVAIAAGNPDVALVHGRRALHEHREIGQRLSTGEAWELLARAHSAVGDREAARNAWRAAYEIYTDLGLPDAERLADSPS